MCRAGGVPHDLGEKLRITMLAAGEDHTLALGDDGGVYAWGAGGRGQLGLGGTRNRPWPTRVTGLRRKVSEVAAGAHFRHVQL